MKLRKIKSKKAALELSIGTIVILVIAMSMLILGLILVRTIFTGAKYNVETMNKKVEAEINKLFVEDQKAVVYLPNREATIKQGDTFGVGFAIQNGGKSGEFTWETIVVDDDRDIMDKCGVRAKDAEDWITTGGSNSRGVPIASGDTYYSVIRYNIAKEEVNDVSTCVVRFQLNIERKDTREPYTAVDFDVVVK
ncbi:MAG: hypothetical protein ABIH37_01015 [archaeon]